MTQLNDLSFGVCVQKTFKANGEMKFPNGLSQFCPPCQATT